MKRPRINKNRLAATRPMGDSEYSLARLNNLSRASSCRCRTAAVCPADGHCSSPACNQLCDAIHKAPSATRPCCPAGEEGQESGAYQCEGSTRPSSPRTRGSSRKDRQGPTNHSQNCRDSAPHIRYRRDHGNHWKRRETRSRTTAAFGRPIPRGGRKLRPPQIPRPGAARFPFYGRQRHNRGDHAHGRCPGSPCTTAGCRTRCEASLAGM